MKKNKIDETKEEDKSKVAVKVKDKIEEEKTVVIRDEEARIGFPCDRSDFGCDSLFLGPQMSF